MLDDVAFGQRGGGKYGMKWFSQGDGALERLFISNRHLGIDVIILLQKIVPVISPKMRSNCSLCVLFPTINVKQSEMLCSEFGFRSFFDTKLSKNR